jgi:glycerophosphoryl diester phosphodiesterase
VSQAASPNVTTKKDKPLIIGHRGASATAPENTLAAFRQAFACGADGIELDVRLARDGIPVVIHDRTLRRTGLVAGPVNGLDSAQLSQVDVGTWFNRANPKFARDEFAAEHVPTLDQVFRLCRNRRATIYVEMKSERDSIAKDLADAVAKLVNTFKFQDRVVVVSFNLAAIATLKKFDSSIRTGALFGSTSTDSRNWRASLLARAADCGADELLLYHLLARRKLVEKAHEANLPVVVWTVDRAKWLERARILGLHALITNHPAKLLTAL